MQVRADTNVDGFLRAESKAARRYVGPMLGPSSMTTLATLVELVEDYGTLDLAHEELAARVGLTDSGLERAIDRLVSFGVASRSADGDELVVKQWVDTPTAAWRENNYPPELAEQFKLFVNSVLATREDFHLDERIETAARAVHNEVATASTVSLDF